MQPTYSKQQIIHSLSLASNSAYGLSFPNNQDCGKSFEQLQGFVSGLATALLAQKEIKKLIGDDWKEVWGPVVYATDENSSAAIADNTMGVYYSPQLNLFVIAIAGTNPISYFGWMHEDFDVNKTVSWKSITGKGKGAIAQGTARGLEILTKKMKFQGRGLLEGLQHFIYENGIKAAEVAVAGHSLGGALSPALALYLLHTQATWDTTNSMKIATYPSAGPTIGTHPKLGESFVSYYESLLAKDGALTFGKIAYHAVKNDLDIVPMAWQASTLAAIPMLYQDFGITPDMIGPITQIAAINKISTHPLPHVKNYRQIQPLTALKGSFDKASDQVLHTKFSFVRYFTPKQLHAFTPALENLVRFLMQAGYQHTTAYSSLLQITQFMDRYDALRTALIPDNCTQKDCVQDQVSTLTGIDMTQLLALQPEPSTEEV